MFTIFLGICLSCCGAPCPFDCFCDVTRQKQFVAFTINIFLLTLYYIILYSIYNENSNYITNGFNGEPDNHPCRNQWQWFRKWRNSPGWNYREWCKSLALHRNLY